MKTEIGVSDTWDDLVFENKNKEYGAYRVRKSYSQNMINGVGLSVAAACLLIVLPNFLSQTETKEAGPLSKLLPELPVVEFSQPPSLEVPPPAQPVTPPLAVNANLAPQVTTETVETELPTNDAINASMVEPGIGDGILPNTPGPDILSQPVIVETGIVDFAEVMPQYEGGLKEMMKFLQRKINYPLRAIRMETEGTVFVAFVVDKDGKVTDVNVVRGISPECDKEAARVISLMKSWTPGMQNHRAVSVRMTLPIKFQLKQE